MHNKCNVLESSQNHPLPWSVEKLFSMKLVPRAKKVGDHCPNALRCARDTIAPCSGPLGADSTPSSREGRGQGWPIRALHGPGSSGLGLTASREVTADIVKNGEPKTLCLRATLEPLSHQRIHSRWPSLSEVRLRFF